MDHLVAHALDGTLLFRTHEEARALFDLVVATFPDAVAFCVMPDHVHIVAPSGGWDRLRHLVSAYARWRNARRGECGKVWRPVPPPEGLPDSQHLRRTVRYVHLNPCRAGLAADPLAWPWSTHRDATGFAVPPVREREHEPGRFHRWVSGDPSVAVDGTILPEGAWGTVRFEQVRDAVAGVSRLPASALTRRGPARTLALTAAWVLDVRDARMLAEELQIALSGVYRTVEGAPPRSLTHRHPALHACVRAVGDPRFEALAPGDLVRTVGWEKYRGKP